MSQVVSPPRRSRQRISLILISLILALFLPMSGAQAAYAQVTPDPAAAGSGLNTPVDKIVGATPTTPEAAVDKAAGGNDASSDLVGTLANQAISAVGNLIGASVAFAVTATLSAVLSSDEIVVFGNCSAGDLNCWFSSQYELMKTISLWVMVPLLLLAIIQAITKGSLLMMLRSVLIYVPIVFLGTAVAAQFVQLLLWITDDMSSAFITDDPSSLFAAAKNVTTFFATDSSSDSTIALLGTAFFKVIMALPMLISALFVWLILILRSASIYLATLFLPIGFATLVWPAASRQFRKLVQFLIAMILSKLVMVAGLAVGIASFTAIGTSAGGSNLDGTPLTAANATQAAGGLIDFTVLNQTILFLAIFMVTAISPTMLMKFLDNFSFGEAAQALGSHHKRPSLTSQILFGARMQGIGRSIRSTGAITADTTKRQAWAAKVSPEQARLYSMGIWEKKGAEYQHGFEITKEDLEDAKVDVKHHDEIMKLSYSNNANDWAVAHMAFAAAQDGWSVDSINADPNANGGVLSVDRSHVDTFGNTIKETIMAPTIESNGRFIVNEDPALVKRAAMKARNAGAQSVIYMAANPGSNRRLQTQLGKLVGASQQGNKTFFRVVGNETYDDANRTRRSAAIIGDIKSQINNTGNRDYYDSAKYT